MCHDCQRNAKWYWLERKHFQALPLSRPWIIDIVVDMVYSYITFNMYFTVDNLNHIYP